jgi:hypothetical protein
MMKTFVHGSKRKLVRLFVHECGRVFSDRLNDEQDVQKLFDQLYVSCRDYLKEDLFTCLKDVIPERLFEDKPNYERSQDMMTEYLRFSDLLDQSKQSN